MDKIFFNNWESIIRILIIGVLSYAALIVMLRISGKRTLSQMNAFDFIVTVALGSTLSSVIVNKDTALADGVLALGLLIGLQFIITKLSVNSRKIDKLVKAQPTLLFYKGEFQEGSMHRERVTKEELIAVMRSEGVKYLRQVDAVVLETNGKYTVLFRSEEEEKEDETSLLKDVGGYDG